MTHLGNRQTCYWGGDYWGEHFSNLLNKNTGCTLCEPRPGTYGTYILNFTRPYFTILVLTAKDEISLPDKHVHDFLAIQILFYDMSNNSNIHRLRCDQLLSYRRFSFCHQG